MAGLTPAGFELKRLPQIISELKEQSVPVFQDLLTNPNDVVDTSDSSNIGRLVNLVSPSLADLWEALQGVYSASDPNSAEGIPLKNLAQLVGLEAQPATASSVQLVLLMDAATTVPQGSIVRATDTGTEWQINNNVSANITNYAASIIVVPAAAVTPQDYIITYRVGTSTSTITFTSPGGQTQREVAEGIKFVIDSVHNTQLSASLVGNTLTIDRLQPTSPAVFTITSNIQLSQMKMVVTATATEVGPLQQDSNTIVSISTPILGWRSVTNPNPATPGRSPETDEELRDRLLTSRSTRAINLWDSLYSALRNLEGVYSVNIEENDSSVTVNGVPPYSYVAVVSGGNDTEIAQEIWRNKPLGISPQGNTSAIAKDVRGSNRTVKFSRPTEIPIYIDLTIVLDTDVFPGDGLDQIKQAIIDFTVGAYQIGDDVIYTRLFTPINQVRGHYVSSMTIGTTASPVGTSNITIAYDEIASFSADNITITTT
jgi:uncharacterized phage protein gp47/JayE